MQTQAAGAQESAAESGKVKPTPPRPPPPPPMPAKAPKQVISVLNVHATGHGAHRAA